MTDKKTMWEEAGKAGLILGGISIAYALLTVLTSKLGTDKAGLAMLISLLNFGLWAAKFAACIYLMKLFMTRYAATDSEITNSQTFGFGVATALLSAILVAGFSLANILFITPDAIDTAFEMISEGYSSMLTSDAVDAMEQMKGMMPQIVFFSNLIYCFLFGTILSAILSRNIPSTNPFE